MKLRLLRLLLLASAFAWAVSAVAIVLPWPMSRWPQNAEATF